MTPCSLTADVEVVVRLDRLCLDFLFRSGPSGTPMPVACSGLGLELELPDIRLPLVQSQVWLDTLRTLQIVEIPNAAWGHLLDLQKKKSYNHTRTPSRQH